MPQHHRQDTTSDKLTDLTLEAVRALLRQIAADTAGHPGNSSAGAVHGTTASFAAQALRDLLQTEPLSQLVADTIREERGE